MPRKKGHDRGRAPVARLRETPTHTKTHETGVDFFRGTADPMNEIQYAYSFLNVLTSGIFDFGTYDLEDDLMYSDKYDCFYPHNAASSLLEPHPRIKQLTDEEADKYAKELIADDDRRKEKTERNRRKKMRKKEKKRLEKENSVKDILPDEEQDNSDSENQEENSNIKNYAEANNNSGGDKSDSPPEAAGWDESGADKEENHLTRLKKEDKEEKELHFNHKPANHIKKGKSTLMDDQLLKEGKPKTVEKSEVEKKVEHKPSKEKTMDLSGEEYAERSRELAVTGNGLAASGQYEMAVKCFTDAIKYNPKEFRLFGNRSLCYERMQQYENALWDADLALSMEPGWIKGLFRKGKALCGLKKYYEASKVYREVLNLDSSSAEAAQELKRAQTLHLMEMGFSWAQSNEALKAHSTLEAAVEALFGGDGNRGPGDGGASGDDTHQPEPVVPKEDDEEGEWIVQQPHRHRAQQVKEADALVHSRSTSHSPTHHPKNSVKPELFAVWVGSLAPTMTYSILHEVFSRVGAVYSIKMLLEQQCAFVNYTRKEECERAIQCFNGMVVEGAPLSVRLPSRYNGGIFKSDPFSHAGAYKKECFFWRTVGCTRQDCTFRHIPEHRNIDRDKFTTRLGQVGNQSK